MKPHTVKSGLVLLSLVLGGCSSTAGSSSTGAAAPVAAPATGTIVAESDMPGVCQNAAAAKYGVPLENVTTQSPVTRSFGQLIQGSVDADTNTFGFDCRFDGGGAFLGLITQ